MLQLAFFEYGNPLFAQRLGHRFALGVKVLLLDSLSHPLFLGVSIKIKAYKAQPTNLSTFHLMAHSLAANS